MLVLVSFGVLCWCGAGGSDLAEEWPRWFWSLSWEHVGLVANK